MQDYVVSEVGYAMSMKLPLLTVAGAVFCAFLLHFQYCL